MRPRHRLPLGELAVLVLAATVGGCSTTGSDEPLATASLAPRPAEGLRNDPPQYNTAASESPKPYTQPYHQPPAYEPRPRQYAQQQPRYDRQYPDPRYAGQMNAPAPYGAAPYSPYSPPPARPTYPTHAGANPTWQASPSYAYNSQAPAYGQAQIQTGSLGRAAAPATYGAPVTTGSLGRAASMIEVREGDTLYKLSRRTGVPVSEIVTANRLPSERIEIGQKLIIPAKPAMR